MRRFFTLLTALLVAASAAPAGAQAPPIIPFQGFLTDDAGTPRDGDVTLDISLYDAATDGSILHAESIVVDVDAGYFSAQLGLEAALDLSIFQDRPDVWVEIVIDDETLDPRIQLGTVPYAAWADYAGDAATLDGMTPEELRVTDWSDLENIPGDLADGDDVLGVGDGLLLTGGTVSLDADQVQAPITGMCPVGSAIRNIHADGTVDCQLDSDTTYDAGSGLVLVDGTFSVDASVLQARVTGSCTAGTALTQINADGSVVCASIDGGTVTAGTGIVVNAGEVGIADDGVGRDQIADDAVGSAQIADAAVTGSHIATNQIRASHILDDAVVRRHIVDDAIDSARVVDGSLTEFDVNLQGYAIVSADAGSPDTVMGTLLTQANVSFTSFRVVFSANGNQGRGSTVTGGAGSVVVDLAGSCEANNGGVDPAAIAVAGGGALSTMYGTDVFQVGTDPCGVIVRVSADDPAVPVIIRDVRIVPVDPTISVLP